MFFDNILLDEDGKANKQKKKKKNYTPERNSGAWSDLTVPC